MIEVTIKEIKYVDDMPLEKKQRDKIRLCKGKVVGLLVQSVEDHEKEALIPLYLKRDEQKKFIKEGLRIVVEQEGELYVIPRCWEEYQLMQSNVRSEQSGVELPVRELTISPKAQPDAA